MERNRSRASCTAVATLAALSVALTAGCAEPPTDSQTAATAITRPQSATTLVAAALEDRWPVIVPLPPADDPTADPQDPVAVASALVTVLTNHRSDLSARAWRDRWSKWVTPALAIQLEDHRTHGTYDEELEAAGAEEIGVVVGSATRVCSAQRCQVIVVADQTLLVEAEPIVEHNFVSWAIDLERPDESGWRVSGISLAGMP